MDQSNRSARKHYEQTRQAEPPDTVNSANIVHAEPQSHGAEAKRRQESSEVASAEQQPGHRMGVHTGFHSRIKA